MLTRARPWLVALAAMVLSIGCRVADPNTPVDGHRELCCRTANPDNVSFVGCRASNHCRGNEAVWVRGPISCGPVDAQTCAGGRCCELDLEQLATPVAQTPADPAAGSATNPTTSAPAPARISPVPLDWRATPVAIAVPKLVCLKKGAHERSVLLWVEVSADAEVIAVEVRRGFDPQCDALARDALLHAKFEPARSPSGEPIRSAMTWAYQFEGE